MSVIYEKKIEKSIVDSETGELLTENVEHTFIKSIKPEDFMQVYLKDISGLMEIENISELKVLVHLWKESSFNSQGETKGNQIFLVKSVKEEISQKCGLEYNTVHKAIFSLHKKGILIRKDRSLYILNPKFFFKGYSKDRTKTVEILLKYRITDTPEQTILFDE